MERPPPCSSVRYSVCWLREQDGCGGNRRRRMWQNRRTRKCLALTSPKFIQCGYRCKSGHWCSTLEHHKEQEDRSPAPALTIIRLRPPLCDGTSLHSAVRECFLWMVASPATHN